MQYIWQDFWTESRTGFLTESWTESWTRFLNRILSITLEQVPELDILNRILNRISKQNSEQNPKQDIWTEYWTRFFNRFLNITLKGISEPNTEQNFCIELEGFLNSILEGFDIEREPRKTFVKILKEISEAVQVFVVVLLPLFETNWSIFDFACLWLKRKLPMDFWKNNFDKSQICFSGILARVPL